MLTIRQPPLKEYELMGARDMRQLRDVLRSRYWSGIDNESVTPLTVAHLLKVAGALWMHSGDRHAPHAQLTSGKCSDGFVDVLRLLRHTWACRLLARALLRKAGETVGDMGPFDWVVGSDHAGAALSHSVVDFLDCQHDFTEKRPDGSQVWHRFRVEPNERVLQVEELITTAKTVRAVQNGVMLGNGGPVEFLPVILTVVNRSGMKDIDGRAVISLLDLTIKTWEPDKCPLCSNGSQRLPPKQFWYRLVNGI